MSLEVLLIPIGIAAVAAIRESRSTDLCEKCKNTRITDQSLLVETLQAIGTTDVVQSDGRVTGHSPYGLVTFQRIGEVFLGRVDKADESVTDSMLYDVESRAGQIMQYRSAERIRQRAAELGMTLITQRAEDGTLQLVFEQA